MGVQWGMTSHLLDESLRLLAHRYRRMVLRELRRSPDGTASFEDVLDRLHEEVPDTERSELAIDLRHTHLPKLADHGVLEYDRRSGAVRYEPDENVETLLDALPRFLQQADEKTL